MLAYSGRGKFQIKTVQLEQIVREMNQILNVSIQKHVTLHLHVDRNLPPIEADVTQLRQVILNLVINASEAIGEDPGAIRVQVGKFSGSPSSFSDSVLQDQLPEKDYLYLEVQDTGPGMNDETRSKIFDPFFTTKFTGRGLGLAAVLGIVRGHHGAIRLRTTPGDGTIFTLYFPVASRVVNTKQVIRPEIDNEIGGTVLLVDDEEMVRNVATRMIEKLGYSVVAAADGLEALSILEKDPKRFMCVILDLTMPKMPGDHVFNEIIHRGYDINVMLASGYNETEIALKFKEKQPADFIQKPFGWIHFAKNYTHWLDRFSSLKISMLRPANNLILQIFAQIHKIVAVARHTDNQVTVVFRMFLSLF